LDSSQLWFRPLVCRAAASAPPPRVDLIGREAWAPPPRIDLIGQQSAMVPPPVRDLIEQQRVVNRKDQSSGSGCWGNKAGYFMQHNTKKVMCITNCLPQIKTNKNNKIYK